MTIHSRRYAQLVTILVGLLTGGVAGAADVQIRVVDAAKRMPLSDAAVCLGTPREP